MRSSNYSNILFLDWEKATCWCLFFTWHLFRWFNHEESWDLNIVLLTTLLHCCCLYNKCLLNILLYYLVVWSENSSVLKPHGDSVGTGEGQIHMFKGYYISKAQTRFVAASCFVETKVLNPHLSFSVFSEGGPVWRGDQEPEWKTQRGETEMFQK